MAGIALKDRVDLISIMVPLEVIAKEKRIYIYKRYIGMRFWIQHNHGKARHECERGCAVSLVHIYIPFLSLYILEKIVLDPVFKRIDTICRL